MADEYVLRETERKHFDLLMTCVRDYGNLYIIDWFGEQQPDKKGKKLPKPYIVLKGGSPQDRHLTEADGRLWRCVVAGDNKDQTRGGGGAKWRGPHVEMWSGHWRKAKKTDGTFGYAKCTIMVSLDPQVNGVPGMTTIQNHTTNKGYKHPLEKPDNPTAQQIAMMEGERAAVDVAVWAKTQELAATLPAAASEAVTNAVQGASHAGPEVGGQSDPTASQAVATAEGPEVKPKRGPGRPKGSRTNRPESSK